MEGVILSLNIIFESIKHSLLEIEPLMTLIITICIMYISYLQWLISKKNEYLDSKKFLNEKFYSPIKEYGENLTKLSNTPEDGMKNIVNWVQELQNNLREISIFFTKTDFELLKEYTDRIKNSFENFESNVSKKIDIFKQFIIIVYYYLIVRHIILKVEVQAYKPSIKIYTIFFNFISNVIAFLIPDFLEKCIKKYFYNLITIIKIVKFLFFFISVVFFKKKKKNHINRNK